jgi:type IV secretory pathway VirB2 component (pilin)
VDQALRGLGARWLHPRRAPRLAGRLGLLARAIFYLLLAYLAARIATLHGQTTRQANANGALAIIARSVVGEIAIGIAAVGFIAFGIERLRAAWRDRDASRWRRAFSALNGVFYLALSYVPISFITGRRQSGSEQAQHNAAAQLLRLPGGRVIVIILGLVVIAVCGWQISTALATDFERRLELWRAPGWVRRVTSIAGIAGITARAVVFFPLGIFLIVSAITYDPNRAKGLDGEMLTLSRHPWGDALIWLATLGLVVFAIYSLLEAKYRKVESAQ